MICVGYSKRASCDPNMGLMSLKEQNDLIREYVRKKEWKLTKIYEDRSDSPDSDNGFQKIREAGLKKEFDVVVLLSVYRFGKNVSFARELLLNAFYRAGIHFVILEDEINSMEMDYEELHDYFISARQRLNCIIGKKKELERLIETNKISELYVSYGYKLSEDSKKLLIDEEAAYIIRKIFEMYDNDFRTDEICEYLNNKGFDNPIHHIHALYPKRTVFGKNKWEPSIIYSIKKNQKYVGYDSVIHQRKIYYPEIISKDVFDRVNEKIKGKSRGKKIDGRKVNPFFNLYYCDGYTEIKYKSSSKAKVYPYFHLVNDKKVLITYAELEDAVRKQLAEEKERCKKVLGLLSSECGRDLIAAIDDEYSEMVKEFTGSFEKCAKERIQLFIDLTANKISKECFDKKDKELLETAEEYNLKLQDISNQCDERKKLLSADNPWIKRYMKYTPDLVFTRKSIKMLIDKIIINYDGSADVKLLCSEADAFPEEWRNVEDGKEE